MTMCSTGPSIGATAATTISKPDTANRQHRRHGLRQGGGVAFRRERGVQHDTMPWFVRKDVLDALIAPAVRFEDLPARLRDILGPRSGVLCQLVEYPAAE